MCHSLVKLTTKNRFYKYSTHCVHDPTSLNTKKKKELLSILSNKVSLVLLDPKD